MINRIKVVVTGATSFIGKALIRQLIERQYEVIAIVRPDSQRKASLATYEGVQIIEVDLEHLLQIDYKVIKGCVGIFHVGWYSDFENSRYNLEGQLHNVKYLENVIELSRRIQCKKIVCIGSQAECGRVEGSLSEKTPDNPETAYAVAKCRAYDVGMILCEKYKIDLLWPRLLSAYGPDDKSRTMIMSCLDAAVNKKEIAFTACEQIWDYIYVDDVANALICIFERGAHGVKYSIASGHGKKLEEYIHDIARITGNKRILAGIGMLEYAPKQVMHLVGDIQRLRKDTGFEPIVTFEEGIKRTLEANFNQNED